MMKAKLPQANKTLCILANTKVGDLYGNKIVNCLKNDFGADDIKLIGNGGEFLAQHDQKSIVDLEDLREKSLYLWRYGVKNIHTMKHNFTNIYQVMLRMNLNLITLMNQNGTFDNISRARPSCIVNLDNEHLSTEIIKGLNGKFNMFYYIKKAMDIDLSQIKI